MAATKRALGWDPDKQFFVPDEVCAHMNQVERGNAARGRVAGRRFARWSEAFPGERETVGCRVGRAGSATWTLPEFAAGEEIATRAAGKTVMQAFKAAVPTMIGGAADLVESTYTEFEGGGLFSDSWAGRNIPFGIREHAMGSIVNGIAAHGGCVKPYGSTFLIFSDYMRPAVRLSALMGLPVVWAWTHDSVGLGEDGPTHQPVETYAALRAIPQPLVHPAGRRERDGASRGRSRSSGRDGPVALSLSRQKVPTLDRSELAPASGLERGAYTLWESSDVARPDPDRHRRRGRSRARRRPQARGGRDRRPRRLDAVLGALRASSRRSTATRCCRPTSRRGCRSSPASRSAGSSGSATTATRSRSSTSARRRPAATVLGEFGYNLDNVVARAAALLERVA